MPLLFLLAERAMKKRRFSFLLALGVCAAVLSSVYMAYMVLLTLGLYLLFRIFTLDETFRFRCILFLKSCCSILLGLLMMMVVFFPSALYILNTSTRLDSNVSVLTRFFWKYEAFLGRFL
jgi:uncharacterized membrane protein YfhO